MQHFDQDFVQHIIELMATIPPDKKPVWGSMTKKELIEHFIWLMKHMLERSVKVPDCSTWFSRVILKPLILHRWIRFPKNMKLPNQLVAQGIHLREPGDMETLQALIEEYLAKVQNDELFPAPHPFLGHLTIDEWDRLHVVHFEHHLKQFSVKV